MLKTLTLDPYSRNEWSKYKKQSSVEKFVGRSSFTNPFKQSFFTPFGVREHLEGGDDYVEYLGGSLGNNARSWEGPYGIRGGKGETGPSGLKGDQGLPGEPGADGDKGGEGPQGPTGKDGGIGPTGEKGDKGDQGIQGTAGAAGSTVGVVGPVGATGPTGKDGQQGFTGKDGLRGPTGQDGKKGDPGAEGKKGDPGVADTATANRLAALESNTLKYGLPLYLRTGNNKYVAHNNSGARSTWERLVPERP
jgi:hypothetical protein